MATLIQDGLVKGILQVAGAFQAREKAIVRETSAARTITAADNGKLILLSYAGAVAITLPAAGETGGVIVDFLIIGANTTNPTWSAAVAGTLRAKHDEAANSANFATGHRIGGYVRFVSDGSFWTVINLSGANTLDITT